MAIGILLITHEGIGNALIAAATRMLRVLPLRAEAFEVPFDGDLDVLLPQASAALRRVDGGQGVLVLTDLYGASPSNLAAKVARLGTPVRRVSALSLPMLLRVMNYSELELDELPAVASAGAPALTRPPWRGEAEAPDIAAAGHDAGEGGGAAGFEGGEQAGPVACRPAGARPAPAWGRCAGSARR